MDIEANDQYTGYWINVANPQQRLTSAELMNLYSGKIRRLEPTSGKQTKQLSMPTTLPWKLAMIGTGRTVLRV